jgi:hypothetical protein
VNQQEPIFLSRTISPYELVENERSYLLDLARKIASAMEPTFAPPEAMYSRNREQTSFLLVATRYGDARHGFQVNESWQDSHGFPKEAGRRVAVSTYGLAGGARIELYSNHWPGHSDAGRGVTLHLSAPEEAVRAVLGFVERMEEGRRQCPDGGRIVGTGGVLPTDPREFGKSGDTIACNRLRCAQCGAFVRHQDDHVLDHRFPVRTLTGGYRDQHSIGVRSTPGGRVYECDCAATDVRELSQPLRGNCDTDYEATWWCAAHPSRLDEIEALDRALPPPWSAWQEAHKKQAPYEPPPSPPSPPRPLRARASDYYQVVASDFGATVEPTAAKTRDEFLQDLRSANSNLQVDAATALRAFGFDPEVLRSLVDVCCDSHLSDAACHSIFEVLHVEWLGDAPIHRIRDLVASGVYQKDLRYLPRPTVARRVGLEWLRRFVDRAVLNDALEYTNSRLRPRWAVGLTKLERAKTDEEAKEVIAEYPELDPTPPSGK